MPSNGAGARPTATPPAPPASMPPRPVIPPAPPVSSGLPRGPQLPARPAVPPSSVPSSVPQAAVPMPPPAASRPAPAAPPPRPVEAPATPQPEPARSGVPATSSSGPRKVKLTVARIDPWSAMKMSFLLSVACGIATVVAAFGVGEMLNAMGVFSELNAQLRDLAGKNSKFDLGQYVGLGRVISLATLVAVVNVVLTMALATLGAVLYNIAGSLVGGLNLTLSDD